MTRGRSRWDFSGREEMWLRSIGCSMLREACCVFRKSKNGTRPKLHITLVREGNVVEKCFERVGFVGRNLVGDFLLYLFGTKLRDEFEKSANDRDEQTHSVDGDLISKNVTRLVIPVAGFAR